MIVVCRRCFRRAQIEMPPIGARLRCTSCNERQVFGTRPRQRREIGGRVSFERKAPAAKATHVSFFDDPIDDLWAAG
jgi:DNA-directed RNA polymerase subunit RPC12/RpoP